MDTARDRSSGPITLDRHIYLVALHPPGNIERIVADLQRSLFHRFGLRPAPGVFVPLAFSRARPAPPRRARSQRCTSGGWAWESTPSSEVRALYLRLEDAGPAAGGGGAESFGLVPGQEPGPAIGPFPIAHGLFVAFDPGLRASGEPTVDREELGAPPALSWAVSSLACTMLSWSGARPWYQFYETTELWSVRLGRSATLPDSSSR